MCAWRRTCTALTPSRAACMVVWMLPKGSNRQRTYMMGPRGGGWGALGVDGVWHTAPGTHTAQGARHTAQRTRHTALHSTTQWQGINQCAHLVPYNHLTIQDYAGGPRQQRHLLPHDCIKHTVITQCTMLTATAAKVLHLSWRHMDLQGQGLGLRFGRVDCVSMQC